MTRAASALTSVFVATTALLVSAATASAFAGRVVTTDGVPIAGAEITILGRPGATATDADGRFTWTPDPPAPFEILVVAPGGMFMKPVLVEALPPDGDLLLTVAPLVAERLVVTGAAPDIESTPGAATASLPQSELQTRLPANLPQALENVPGVQQVSEGQAGVPAIRGLSGGRTLILIDGARVVSERRAGAGATFVDPDVLEAVDVARGPGSVAYGSDAFGGVIALTTRKVAHGAPLRARISGTAGTGVPERRLAAELSRGFARGSVLLAGHLRDVDDWRSPNGPVANSGYADRGLLVRATHDLAGGRLSAGYQGDRGRDIGRPRDNTSVVRFLYPREDSDRITGEYDRAGILGLDELGLHAFWGRYAQLTDQDRRATATAGRSLARASVTAQDFQARAYGRRAVGSSRLELGLDLNGRTGLEARDVAEQYDLSGVLVRRTDIAVVTDARRVDAAAYASVEAPVASNLSVGAGLRADRITTATSGGWFGRRTTANGAASGYVSASAQAVRGLTLTAQLSRGFRDPMLSDRYYRGPTGRGFITGNPDLQSETSLQVDTALRLTTRRVRAGLFAYRYRIDGLVERYQTTPDDFFFRNRGRADIRGVELEALADLPGRTTVEVAATVQRGTAADGRTALDGISAPTLSTQVRRAVGTRGYAQLRAGWIRRDDRPGPTERSVPAATLLDAGAGATIGRLELRLLMRNLLDWSYLASQDVRAVAAAGRSASLTAVIRF